ncbi:helix-turn-helix transcriptional regulator [Rhodococcoides yunnanense]|uniref:helix-turn-helix transcriptional regulator n=1 Tax=Rhodococcoides yunnanense TaxID=278209 RepID=UPI000933883C|nr:helix-turn-helix transcriptional regulator [Rhodococcus yunnanensis]
MTTTASDLGTVLRGWRDRLSPADAGMPVGARRRTSGLRREELAQLAGLSVDYLVRLEQGRATNPSAQVAAALSRALQLDRSERDHLYRCAGLLPPSDTHVSRLVTPGIGRLVSRLGDIPVGVFAADWDLLAWNPMWAALHGDPGGIPLAQRNLVRALFGADDRARTVFSPSTQSGGLEHLAHALVADLRVAAATYPNDPTLTALVGELRSENPYFDSLWTSGPVAVHSSERKTIHHHDAGDITLDCDVLNAPGSDVRLVVYTAATASPDADKLDFLRVAAGAAGARR